MDELMCDTETVLAAELAADSLDDDAGQCERIAAAIEQAVWRETGGRVKSLRVEVRRPGGVLLTGRSNTYYAKQQAQHAAMRVAAGNPLINEIEVV